MSVADQKKKQNYRGKPLQKRCRVCKYLKAETFTKNWGDIGEKLRCGIGGFAVTPNACCDLFELQENHEKTSKN